MAPRNRGFYKEVIGASVHQTDLILYACILVFVELEEGKG